MSKNQITFFFFLIISTSFCQRNEVGISILDYSSVRDYQKLVDTVNYGDSKYISSLLPVITFNHVTAKDIDFYVQLGFFAYGGNITNKATTNSGINYDISEIHSRSVFIKLGIAKRYYFDKLVFSVGVNLPFEYNYYMLNEKQNYTYSLTHVPIDFTQTHDRQAPHIVTGLYLHQSLYYSLFKNFYLGIDLNLGFRSSITL